MASFELVVCGERRLVTVYGGVLVGRDPLCDVVLPEPNVSRTHFSLVTEGSRTVLWDQESRNGTYVNFQRVMRYALSHGDRIHVGGVNIIYWEEEAADLTNSVCSERFNRKTREKTWMEDSSLIATDASASLENLEKVGLFTARPLQVKTPAPAEREPSWMGRAVLITPTKRQSAPTRCM